jgi:hypothetical protein
VAAFIHFVLILGSVVLAGALTGRYTAPLSLRRALWCLPALLVPLVAMTAGLHRCDAGAPLSQWLVPSMGLFAVILFVEAPKQRWMGAGALAAIALGLSFHYAAVVHGATWVGNPDSQELEGAAAHPEWHTAVTRLYRR